MRIGIEARMMGAENTRGLGRYIQELVAAMLKVAPENEYVLLTRSSDHALRDSPQVKTVVADVPWYGLAEQMKVPRILKSLQVDVVHVPHWNVPLLYSGPLVVTIHDLLLLHQPASANASTRAWPVRLLKRSGFKITLKHAVRTAKKICVPTEFVKRDLGFFFPEAVDKIVVTGEGVTHFGAVQINDIKRLEAKRLLYLGSAYPHKRLDLLLQAWKSFSDSHPDWVLDIGGEMDGFMSRTQDLARSMGLRRVNFLGRVPDSSLDKLFAEASVLVWPSSFEGFGLTPLEALARGCPVVSSDAPPMPEVLGKKGVVYFKNGSVDDMINAMIGVVDNLGALESQAVESRSELLARHDWEKAARITLEAYRQAIE